MSNIYINEPPTSGKVLLVTSLGDIDIELWARETPKACRNFVQLSMEGYYDGLIFHRIVRDFCAQGGDPKGTGQGGESIYGRPFKDEIHQRLRFNRRGLVAMANSGRDDNGSQFFFTLGAAPELDKKHTIFGKVTGDTLYNMLRFNDIEIGPGDRPLYPPKILRVKILDNPFDDIVPRDIVKKDKDQDKEKSGSKKSKSKAVKNFSVLSFGEEAQDEENELDQVIEKSFKHKSKSLHDAKVDPKMVAEPALAVEGETPSKRRKKKEEDGDESRERKYSKRAEPEPLEEDSDEEDDEDDEKKRTTIADERVQERPVAEKENEIDEDEEDEEMIKKKKLEDMKRESKRLLKELRPKKESAGEEVKNDEGDANEIFEPRDDDDEIARFKAERQKFIKKKKDMEKTMKKGAGRQDLTMNLLDKFKNKLKESQERNPREEDSKGASDEDVEAEDIDLSDDRWLTHSLRVESNGPVLAKDANVYSEDKFDIFDPRNPLNERRRKEDNDRGKVREKERRKDSL